MIWEAVYLYPQLLHAFPCLSAFPSSGAWGSPPAAAGTASGSGSFSSHPRAARFVLGGARNQTAILPGEKGCFLLAASWCSLFSYLPHSLRVDSAPWQSRAVPSSRGSHHSGSSAGLVFFLQERFLIGVCCYFIVLFSCASVQKCRIFASAVFQ